MITPLTQLHDQYPTYFWILFAIFWVAIVTGAIAGISAAPWVPTKRREKRLLAEKLIFKSGQKVYDLGCGTGTILIELAKKNPPAMFIGFEISIIPYVIAKLRSLRYKNVKIKYKNLFTQPLNEADTVIVFLLTKAYGRLKKKFKTELSDEARVVIQAWPLDGIRPHNVLKEDKALSFYIYRGLDFK